MSISTIVLYTLLSAYSPRSSQAIEAQQPTSASLGLGVDVPFTLVSRPERSKGGALLLPQLGVRAAYLTQPLQDLKLVVGGEADLRAGLPETGGNETVYSRTYLGYLQVGGLCGYRLSTAKLSLTPHVSAGLLSGLAVLNMHTPSNDSLRPRLLVSPYVGAGVIGTFLLAMLRYNVAIAMIDGRPEYRFDLGMGVYL